MVRATLSHMSADQSQGPLVRFERRRRAPGLACEACGHVPKPTIDREVWVEVPLDDWIAAYRIVPKRRQPTVAEVRLFPSEGKRRPGRWSGDPRSVPENGIPGTHLKRLRLKDAFSAFAEVIARWDRAAAGYVTGQMLPAFGMDDPTLAMRRPGRRGRPDLHYALWAKAYVDRLREGSFRPIADLSEDPPSAVTGYVSDSSFVSPGTIRAILAEARRRGLLGPAGDGRPGGSLTRKAVALLRALPDADDDRSVHR